MMFFVCMDCWLVIYIYMNSKSSMIIHTDHKILIYFNFFYFNTSSVYSYFLDLTQTKSFIIYNIHVHIYDNKACT